MWLARGRCDDCPTGAQITTREPRCAPLVELHHHFGGELPWAGTGAGRKGEIFEDIDQTRMQVGAPVAQPCQVLGKRQQF